MILLKAIFHTNVSMVFVSKNDTFEQKTYKKFFTIRILNGYKVGIPIRLSNLDT